MTDVLRPEENYGTVLKDCSKAIALNATSSKAYYRSALALVALERLDEAIDCCERCLQFDKENASVKSTLEKALKLKEAKEKKANYWKVCHIYTSNIAPP